MKAFIIFSALLLTGCATSAKLVQVKVPIPIPCQVAEPARPMMDTETIPIESPIDELTRAMRAEIDRREGYEGELRAALNACKKRPTD